MFLHVLSRICDLINWKTHLWVWRMGLAFVIFKWKKPCMFNMNAEGEEKIISCFHQKFRFSFPAVDYYYTNQRWNLPRLGRLIPFPYTHFNGYIPRTVLIPTGVFPVGIFKLFHRRIFNTFTIIYFASQRNKWKI